MKKFLLGALLSLVVVLPASAQYRGGHCGVGFNRGFGYGAGFGYGTGFGFGYPVTIASPYIPTVAVAAPAVGYPTAVGSCNNVSYGAGFGTCNTVAAAPVALAQTYAAPVVFAQTYSVPFVTGYCGSSVGVGRVYGTGFGHHRR